MTAFAFVQWCFRDGTSGLTTMLVLYLLFEGLQGIARALRGRK